MKRYKKVLGVMVPSSTGEWVSFDDYDLDIVGAAAMNDLMTSCLNTRDQRIDGLRKQLEETTLLLNRIVECFPPSFLKEQCEVITDIVNIGTIFED